MLGILHKIEYWIENDNNINDKNNDNDINFVYSFSTGS